MTTLLNRCINHSSFWAFQGTIYLLESYTMNSPPSLHLHSRTMHMVQNVGLNENVPAQCAKKKLYRPSICIVRSKHTRREMVPLVTTVTVNQVKHDFL